MDAYACHFLTDIFASGHMRTPRKALHFADSTMVECANVGSIAGDFNAQYMHDEDNSYGLQTTIKNGDSWTAYGDNKLYSKENAKGLEVCSNAARASADEIWASFSNPSRPIPPKSSATMVFVPDLEAMSRSSLNAKPLFAVGSDGKKIMMRDPWQNRNAGGAIVKMDMIAAKQLSEASQRLRQLPDLDPEFARTRARGASGRRL